MKDIQKAIKLLETIKYNLKVTHMVREMSDDLKKEEIEEYIEDFRLLTVAIDILAHESKITMS